MEGRNSLCLFSLPMTKSVWKPGDSELMLNLHFTVVPSGEQHECSFLHSSGFLWGTMVF